MKKKEEKEEAELEENESLESKKTEGVEKVERRSKASILRDILRTVQNKNGKAKPTHILYGANLSHDRLTKYLDSLVANEFLKKIEENGQTYYVLTAKGSEFLAGFKKMKKFFDAFGVSI
jgi:predicted transcriptional regulator